MDRVLLEEKINRLTAEDGRILARRESAVKWLRAVCRPRCATARGRSPA